MNNEQNPLDGQAPQPGAEPPVPPQPQAQPPQPVQPSQPAQPPVEPQVVPAQTVAPSQPVQQPQPGMPAQTPAGPMPGQPQSVGPAPQAPQLPKKRGFNPLFAIIPVALILAVVMVLVVLASLSSGGISTSDLVDETESGFSFQRPGMWDRIEEDGSIGYTLDGKAFDDSEQGMVVASQSLGGLYSSLTDEQKNDISENLKTQFSDPEELAGDDCKTVEGLEVTEESLDGFDYVLVVNAECTELEEGGQARVRLFTGIAGDTLYLSALTLPSSVWDDSQAAVDAIFASFQPVAN